MPENRVLLVSEDSHWLIETSKAVEAAGCATFSCRSFNELQMELGKGVPILILLNSEKIQEPELYTLLGAIPYARNVSVFVFCSQIDAFAPAYSATFPGWIEYLLPPVPGPFITDKILKLLSIKRSSHIRLSGNQKIDEKEELKEKLNESQNLTILGRLASGVAHDFNNVLGGILGYAEIAKLKFGQSNSPLENYADSIIAFAKRAGELTKTILSFSGGSRKKKHTLDMHNILTEVNNFLFHTIDKKYQLKTSFKASQVNVVGDTGLIQNAVINLCLNARDAMPEGGIINLSTENVNFDKKAAGSFTPAIAEGPYIAVSVADQGAGIQENIQNKIFQPFFTTKERGKGTGLGLSSVQTTVLDHKGAIEVESIPEKGALFKIYLPIGSVKEVQADDYPTRKIPTIAGTLLIIDDEKAFREIMQEMLTDFGYRVYLASDGLEANSLYKEHADEIDLVIIDMNLPMQTGQKCFLSLKKINPSIKAILCTGFGLSEEIQPALAEGIMGFIQKPFEIKQLLKLIAKVLKH